MILPPLENKLTALKLTTVASCIEQSCKDANIDLLSITDLLESLLDKQIEHNRAVSATRMRRFAALRWPDATLANSAELRAVIKPAVFTHIQSCGWLDQKAHVLIEGPTGSGKTHLACAIGNEVIANGFRVQFFRYRDLLIRLVAAEKEGELRTMLRKLLRIDVIIIDDWVSDKLTHEEQAVLFEFIEKREKRASLVITTQFETKVLHKAVGGDTIADAILDRIVPMSYRLSLNHDIAFRSIKATSDVKKKSAKGG
ncbi:ATP-binding protein [Paraglaciecola sp.]|uniref:ATP-binding protein n=1 Tax=Paraglaciecola sp. TaxID=1920173 RepID=UPI003264F790